MPTLITHGRRDSLILPLAAEMSAAAIKGARIAWYDDCGHSPFYEDAPRYNRELAAFAQFDNDVRSVTAKYTHDPNNNFFAIPTDNPDRNYATLSIGASMLFQRGISGFVSFTTVAGLKDVRNRSVVLGVRAEF